MLATTQIRALANQPVGFAASFLRIRNKAMQLIPLRYNRAQKHYLKHRTPRDLILKARQLGISTLIQAEITRLALTRPTSALTLADKGNNMTIFREMAENYYAMLPPAFERPPRKLANASITTYPTRGSQVVIDAAGSPTSGRGHRFNVMHGSEVAFWKNANLVMSGALQAVPSEGFTWVVLESTANGASGWFYNECMAALEGRSNWTLHFYAWWWEAGYCIHNDAFITYTPDELKVIDLAAKQGFTLTDGHIKWRRAKQKELGFRFLEEYPETVHEAFITSGNSVFGQFTDCLYTPTKEDTDYKEGHRYVAGIDWGQENDYTCLSIIDASDGREVLLERWNKMAWDTMQLEIVERLVKYQVEKVRPEKNSMGTTNIEFLASKIEERVNQGDYKHMPAIAPFSMSNPRKQKLVHRFNYAIHDDDDRLYIIDYDWSNAELRAFSQSQTESGLYKFAASNDQHDDSVIARMAANDAAQSII